MLLSTLEEMAFNSAFCASNDTAETSNTTHLTTKLFPWQSALIIGVIFTFFCLFGFVSNILAIRIVCNAKKHLNSSSNQFLILSFLGIFASVVLIPFNIAASFDQEFSIGISGCELYAFFFTLVGLLYVTINTVSVIQSYRIIVTNTIPSVGFAWKPSLFVFGSCICICGIVAACPLLGINEYREVRTPILCHVRWKPLSAVETSFSILTLVSFFIIPVTVVPILYTAIYNKVSKGPAISNASDRRAVYVANSFVISGVTFMLAWTPFSILAMLETFGTLDFIESSSVQITASLVAKVSLTWTPTIYLLRHKIYQKHYKEMMDGIAEKITFSSSTYILESPRVNTQSSNIALTESHVSNVTLIKTRSLDQNV